MTKNEIELAKWNGVVNTARLISFLILAGFCVSKICDTFVALNDDPPWVKAITTTISFLGTFVVPYTLYYQLERKYKEFVRDYADRLTKIEGVIDPNRTSSGLRRDGTDPLSGQSP